jgi:carbon storage regulator
MLVLSRKTGESVRIGNNIAVVVLQVKGNRVRIGIEAPRPIGIVREELRSRTGGSFGKREPVARGMEHAARVRS